MCIALWFYFKKQGGFGVENKKDCQLRAIGGVLGGNGEFHKENVERTGGIPGGAFEEEKATSGDVVEPGELSSSKTQDSKQQQTPQQPKT